MYSLSSFSLAKSLQLISEKGASYKLVSYLLADYCLICRLRAQCIISKGNDAMLCLSLFSLKQCIIKQLLDSVFVISEIINVSVSVISLDPDFFGYRIQKFNKIVFLGTTSSVFNFFLKANYSLGEL